MNHKHVVITGTRYGRRDLAERLDRYTEFYGWPDLWILGDAEGVDKDTQEWLKSHGKTNYVVKHVDESTPSPQRFHDRNQAMVDCANGDGACIAFPDSRSRGTWDCVRRARAAGLVIFICKEAKP